MSRLESGGRIDRSTTVTFSFDGQAFTGHPGDTLASALLAHDVRVVGHSLQLGRPRGIFTAGPEEPIAFVHIPTGPLAAPSVPATTVELVDGLVAERLSGKGIVPAAPAKAHHDKGYLHCDVLVVGAGPAGLAAARAAGTAGVRVLLVDERLASIPAELAELPDVRPLERTTAVGYYDHNYVLAVQRRSRGSRLWHIRAGRVVLATGAHERPIVFADNDRPGIMLAGAARTYVHRFGVRPGRRAVVFTACDSAYDAAQDLRAAGVEVVAVADARQGQAVVGTEGPDELTAVHFSDGTRIECDLLAVSGGWNPAVQLFCQAGGRLRYDEDVAAFVPAEVPKAPQNVRVAGAARGIYADADCVADGHAAGLGEEPRVQPVGGSVSAHWRVPEGDPARQFVDLERDQTVQDIERAVSDGMRSVELIKRYTTINTGADQGRTGAVVAIGIIAELLDRSPGEVGTTTSRPPYTPVRLDVFAGRDRGRLSDPVRHTALHEWHVEHDAVFEDVGQWKRPWYFPLPGEDMHAAVLRECARARESVAMMDASTLGKIELQGPDVAAFLDLIYTNRMSTLKIGQCRYGMMCTADGMVLDDGVAARLADRHYYTTTTTGNAAAVLDWMEEWLQTERPDLRVFATSVTDHWATIALVGPAARDVLAPLAPDLPLDVESFPFMTLRPASVLGVPARVFRVSFSGELAYEINVPAWHALPLWERLIEAGVTPYGTETMHVLRAEKGFAIVGQETDGTVTPHDLGMSWIVSKKKADFVGRRSYARVDTARTDRQRMVGLLPEDGAEVLPEGAQLVLEPGDPPLPMVGHVTSSYPSAALGRSFALAMVSDVPEGSLLYAPLPDRTIAATVTSPVFYDSEGSRRDG